MRLVLKLERCSGVEKKSYCRKLRKNGENVFYSIEKEGSEKRMENKETQRSYVDKERKVISSCGPFPLVLSTFVLII